MTEEEKKKVIFRMSKESFETAKKLIAASGKKPLEYSPVTRECMAAMIYGTLFATSVEELGYFDWMNDRINNSNHTQSAILKLHIDSCIEHGKVFA